MFQVTILGITVLIWHAMTAILATVRLFHGDTRHMPILALAVMQVIMSLMKTIIEASVMTETVARADVTESVHVSGD